MGGWSCDLWRAGQTLLRLLCLPEDFIFFFKEKTTFWYLFVAAAVSRILIKLHLVTTGHLFPEGAIFKDFEVKTQTHRPGLPCLAKLPYPVGRVDVQEQGSQLRRASLLGCLASKPCRGQVTSKEQESHKPSLGWTADGTREPHSLLLTLQLGGQSGRDSGWPVISISCFIALTSSE